MTRSLKMLVMMLVVFGAAHALAHRLHVRHVLLRRVVGIDRAGFALLLLRNRLDAEVLPIDMAQLSRAFGWPGFGGKLAGREIEWYKVDDESEPSKGVENATRLVQRDKVDVLLGTVHSGVQMGIHRVARESGVLNLIPNAGVHAATRAMCAPRSSAHSGSSRAQVRA